MLKSSNDIITGLAVNLEKGQIFGIELAVFFHRITDSYNWVVSKLCCEENKEFQRDAGLALAEVAPLASVEYDWSSE